MELIRGGLHRGITEAVGQGRDNAGTSVLEFWLLELISRRVRMHIVYLYCCLNCHEHLRKKLMTERWKLKSK